MSSQPKNFFRELAGVPVLYDRLKPTHYGITGIPYKFHCTPDAQAVLETFVRELVELSVPSFGSIRQILSAGAWVNKPGQHGAGKAFDLDAVHWERIRLVALQQPTQKPLYLAVQALCHKHFGVVLGYDYNAAHRDHFHIDISRDVRFRPTSSVTTFLQQVMNTFFGQTLEVDGEYAQATEKAFQATLALLKIPDVDSVPDWRRFLDAVSAQGVQRAAAGLDAETVAGLVVESGSVDPDPPLGTADLDADPSLAASAEIQDFAAANLLSTRPDTGLIDLGYKPCPSWTISARTAGGKERWFLTYPGGADYYLGYRFSFGDRYVGLARSGSAATSQIPFDHKAFRELFGDWASFLNPTARCESEAQFLVLNAWDAAAMTAGFFQMAAHTGEHLAALFRELIDALPDEADRFFPEIKLGKHIGHGEPMQLFAVNGTDRLDLDKAAAPADGLPYSAYYRGRFMRFFNPHRGRLDEEEVAAAARWIAWMVTSPKAREVCVRNAVAAAKKAVKRVHTYVRQEGHPDYPNGLDGVSIDLVAAAMDVKHHGRRNRELGQSPDESIFAALTASDPLAAFAKIDTEWREERSRRNVAEIKAMAHWFQGKRYDASSDSFH